MAPPHELEFMLVTDDAVAVFRQPAHGRLAIGRSEENDVCVADQAVSRRHAVIHVGPPLEIEDLGGANGTQVRPAATGDATGHATNATVSLRRVQGRRARLAVGDVVLLGGALLAVRYAADADARGTPGVPGTPGQGPDAAVVIDPAMRRVYEQAARAALGLLSVLVLGETGVGKDVLARAVHRASPRAARPFVALNCAALAESLLESELFGHEKGAFTGAVQARPGLFEAAEGGTVFLDEIGDLPMTIQVKLLRVLEQREVLRVGARTPRAIDVRFVAATNKDLEVEVAAGRFRQDLFFRLSAFTLTVPPLRERLVEVPELARRFLAAACRQMNRAPPPALSPATLAALQAHAWPGNVRELRNVIERAAVLAEGPEILPEDLPPRIVAPAAAGRVPPSSVPAPPLAQGDAVDRLKREVATAARARILDALARCDGNQTRAAELLGVSRRTLINWLDEHAIERPRKRG